MNEQTRKAFLVLFVVCVIVIPIACYFVVFLSSLSLSFLKGFQSISGDWQALPSFFKRLRRLVKWHHYIVALFWEQAADESEKGNLHPILGVCLMSLWSAIATCWEWWRPGLGVGGRWGGNMIWWKTSYCIWAARMWVMRMGDYTACVKPHWQDRTDMMQGRTRTTRQQAGGQAGRHTHTGLWLWGSREGSKLRSQDLLYFTILWRVGPKS